MGHQVVGTGDMAWANDYAGDNAPAHKGVLGQKSAAVCPVDNNECINGIFGEMYRVVEKYRVPDRLVFFSGRSPLKRIILGIFCSFAADDD